MENNIIEELLEHGTATAFSYQPGRFSAMGRLAILFEGAVKLTFTEADGVPGSTKAVIKAVRDESEQKETA